MGAWLKRWGWPACKIVLGVAILVAIGRQFYRDLQGLDLRDLTLRPRWLAASGGLYVLALGCSAFFWYRLLRVFEQRPSLRGALRAYYLGHLGKYLPGKAWALVMRGSLVRGPDVLLGVAIITSFYEVLTTMAAGALLAAVLFVVQPPAATDLTLHPVFLGVLLVAVLGVPLLPWVFNRLVRRMAARFQNVESLRLPRLRLGTLVEGLAITGCCWVLFGISLWSAMQAFVAGPHPLTLDVLGRYVAIMGLAYVAGFLVLVVPSGVGVREYVLLRYLVPELARHGVGTSLAVTGAGSVGLLSSALGQGPLLTTSALVATQVGMAPRVVALAVLLLRLIWTTTELIVAGVVYWLPSGARGQRSEVKGQRSKIGNRTASDL